MEETRDLFLDIERYIPLPIEVLHKADWNYKEDDHIQARALEKSIRERGQIITVIVREIGRKKKVMQYEVVDGNHRLDVFHSIGMTRAMCYNLGKIDVEDAIEISIVANHTRFPTDELQLSDVLVRVAAKYGEEHVLETMPFTHQHSRALLDAQKFDWSQYEPVQGDDDLITFSVTMPAEARVVFLEAVEKINDLPDVRRRSRKYGYVLEMLSADFLAGCVTHEDDTTHE
jgi:hypothetical protein